MANYVCDFWISHPLNRSCDCQKRFKVLASNFKHGIREKYGKWADVKTLRWTKRELERPVYPSEITHAMRNAVIMELGGVPESGHFEALESRNLA